MSDTAAETQSPAAAPAAAAPAAGGKKSKSTFMLHDPVDMSSLGKYVSTDYRYAALKVASRGHKKILLRKTNTKEVRQFDGDVVTLDTPKEIHRGDRVITYNKKPTVKCVGKFIYNGPVDDDAPEEEAAAAPVEAAPAAAARRSGRQKK